MASKNTKKSKRNIEFEKLERMAHVLKAISHPVRLKIVELLESNTQLSVAEILRQTGIEQSLLSHHLTKMKDKGVLISFREGRNIYYTLAVEEIAKIFDCMETCDLFK